jgi:hypothetical protein
VSRVPAAATADHLVRNPLLMINMLISAIIGLGVGALAGRLAFAALASGTTATAFLRLQNPVELTAIAVGASQTTPGNQTAIRLWADPLSVAKRFRSSRGQEDGGRSRVLRCACQWGVGDHQKLQRQIRRRSRPNRADGHRFYGRELAQRVEVQLRTLLPTLSVWQQRDIADATRMQDLQRSRENIQFQGPEARAVSAARAW